jgi:hypothetical protein
MRVFRPFHFLSCIGAVFACRLLAAEDTLVARELFNGKDLSGWQVIDGKPESWRVDHGILKSDGSGGWLSTREEFRDFELVLEFRVISEGANSGIFVRTPHEPNPTQSGLEIQLLDDCARKFRDRVPPLKPHQYTGGLYGLAAPSARVSKRRGEWQRMEIICRGRNIQAMLNDIRIFDVNLDDHRRKADVHPGINRDKGYIGLQSHGGAFEFRHVRLREFGETYDATTNQ